MEYISNSMYYIPSKFQVGKGKAKIREIYGYESVKNISEIAIPSCRFMLEDWTELRDFENITGFRPTNMVDKSKEISKMLTGNVFEVENVPTRGFKILDYGRNDLYQARGYSYDPKVYLEDPRGFNIQINASYIMDLVTKKHISIIDGVIDTEFIYIWNNNKQFEFVWVGDSAYTNKENIITEEQLIKKFESNPGFKTKDLVQGTVYDYEDHGVKSRVLYLGKRSVISKQLIKKLYTIAFVHDIKHTVSLYEDNKNDLLSYYDVYFPWKNMDWKSIASNELKIKDDHVFLFLKELPACYGHTDYGHINFSIENILYGNKKDNTLNLIDNISVLSGGKKIRRVSDDQTIGIIDNPRSWSYRIKDDNYDPGTFKYKKYTLDDVLSAYDKFLEKTISTFKTFRELCPVTKPRNVDEYYESYIKFASTYKK